MSREQQISNMAYALWEQEGRPDGRADQHWMTASHMIESESGPAKLRTTKTVTTTNTSRRKKAD